MSYPRLSPLVADVALHRNLMITPIIVKIDDLSVLEHVADSHVDPHSGWGSAQPPHKLCNVVAVRPKKYD